MGLFTLVTNRKMDKFIKFLNIFRSYISQIRIFGLVPNLFNRVEVWGVSRQPFDLDISFMTIQIIPDQSCPMNTPTIHNDD